MYIRRSVIKKMLKDAGAKRVSNDALDVLQVSVNRIAYSLAFRSVQLTNHRKADTVAESDAKLAVHTNM